MKDDAVLYDCGCSISRSGEWMKLNTCDMHEMLVHNGVVNKQDRCAPVMMRKFTVSMSLFYPAMNPKLAKNVIIVNDPERPVPIIIGFDARTMPIGKATLIRAGDFMNVNVELVQDPPDEMILSFSGRVLEQRFEQRDNFITKFEILALSYVHI